jgi:stress response protein YsnF
LAHTATYFQGQAHPGTQKEYRSTQRGTKEMLEVMQMRCRCRREVGVGKEIIEKNKTRE